MIAIDSDREYECAWSPQLRPSGEGTFDKETFDQWWRKAKPFIPHLHPQIAEQWIYKHWTNSPYCYLPLQNLDWRCEEWKTDAIFRDIFVRPSFGPNQPESDFKFFTDGNYSGREPWKTIRSTGSWNYPIVVILTPDGLRSEGVHHSVPYCLIEGHQRQRFLQAWHQHGSSPAAERHLVFVLSVVAPPDKVTRGRCADPARRPEASRSECTDLMMSRVTRLEAT